MLNAVDNNDNNITYLQVNTLFSLFIWGIQIIIGVWNFISQLDNFREKQKNEIYIGPALHYRSILNVLKIINVRYSCTQNAAVDHT